MPWYDFARLDLRAYRYIVDSKNMASNLELILGSTFPGIAFEKIKC